MATINEHYLKLPANYLFPEMDRRVRVFLREHPEVEMISLGRGDVSQPLPPTVVEALKKAAEEMAHRESFHGYGPAKGYDFLAEAIMQHDFRPRGIELQPDEIFISDGAKSDTANIQEIFGLDNRVAVTDPVYPLYVDTNVMAGRTGPAGSNGQYEGIVYLPSTPENQFTPELPRDKVDLIYLCSPNNPTGAVTSRDYLTEWVDYARENHSIILFDAAYEAYIRDSRIPHSIYEIPGGKEVAIEFRSFSKSAGFTGVRCAFTVVPQELVAYTRQGRSIKVNPIWHRRHSTKFNGASYLSQAAAAAVYTPEGLEETRRIIDDYLDNAAAIRSGLRRLGYQVYGGENAPYVWMRTPEGLSSWEYFDLLLHDAHVVGTPGSGFGAAGEGFFRLSAFASRENLDQAIERIGSLSL